MTKVKTAADVPIGKHYAVIVYKSETIYEDNGYSDYDNKRVILTPEHYVFLDHLDWVEYIQKLETGPTSLYEKKATYIAFVLNSLAKVDVQVTVGVKE